MSEYGQRGQVMSEYAPRPVDEQWPAHAGHQIVVSETVRSEYKLNEVLTWPDDPTYWDYDVYEVPALNSEVTYSEVVCNTCSVVLD
jgi:hypothetical protein